MLRSRIIPTLLLHQNGLVKTRQFKEPKYVGDPLNAVKIFNEKEVDELMFVDIDATVESREPNMPLLRSLAIESRMPLCYSGGVTRADQALRIVSTGFEKVSVSSAALANPVLIKEMSERIGAQSVVVTLDVKANRLLSGYTIYTHNGKQKQRQPFLEFCQQAVELGAGEIVINSIDRDGEMAGYDLELARQVRSVIDSPMTMQGGAGSTEHMQSLIDAVGVVGAAAGSMFVFRGPYRAVLINYSRPGRLCGQAKP
jgi:imidazole glycerol-phosphate synthase subunit HisF